MINANPEEIYGLAELLARQQGHLVNITNDLASLRSRLLRLWPDNKGREVCDEVRKVEALNEEVVEVIKSQFDALLAAYELFVESSKVDVTGEAY